MNFDDLGHYIGSTGIVDSIVHVLLDDDSYRYLGRQLSLNVRDRAKGEIRNRHRLA